MNITSITLVVAVIVLLGVQADSSIVSAVSFGLLVFVNVAGWLLRFFANSRDITAETLEYMRQENEWFRSYWLSVTLFVFIYQMILMTEGHPVLALSGIVYWLMIVITAVRQGAFQQEVV